MRKVCVVGVGSTAYGKNKESNREMLTRASLDALEDAGVDPKEVDGAFFGNAFAVTERQGHIGPLVMSALGIPDAPSTTVEAACASAGAAFREAWVNVASGLHDVFLAGGTEKVSTIDTLTATGYFAYGSDYVFEGGNGCSFPGLYAAMATAHMHEHGTTSEDLAEIAVKNHKHAVDNPKAHLQKAVTVEDVLGSMEVASPLHFYDCCPFSDGATAVVLCSEEVAKKLTDTPVYVQGAGRAGSVAALHDRESFTSIPATKRAAAEALKMAGKTVQDIDLFEVHDCFTIAEAIATEDLGLFKPGTGAKQAREGVTYRDGKVPVNPSGGLKAKGHPVGATGTGQIVEAVLQLRGEAGKRQVDGAETVLTHNVGATGGSCAVHIFGRSVA
ncbi:MAG: thiolase domain-containing protein [Euryarchaeota archaeon]|nr:thiolase domain-containing protein [Euryarchaeota archaeon]